ncbi:helix-turn-helix domain-containing protein, partial [Mycolicibacterium smegmatis]|uniref:helix-turn-helix domain-containing protein n=1 Tax=Mycolicibacterium smegmatis TaxID=1772 RepID=UPI0023DAE3D4
ADHGEDDMAVLRGYLELAGNKSALAKRLHMSRPALYSRLAAIGSATSAMWAASRRPCTASANAVALLATATTTFVVTPLRVT